jgi:hypothetical protein
MIEKIKEVLDIVGNTFTSRKVRETLEKYGQDVEATIDALLSGDSIKKSHVSMPPGIPIAVVAPIARTGTSILGSSNSSLDGRSGTTPPPITPDTESLSRGGKSGSITPPRSLTPKISAIWTPEEETKLLDPLEHSKRKEPLSIVVIGHVDAGKSTLMGHLLYALGYVSQRTISKYEKEASIVGKATFHFAWVMDEHEEEVKQKNIKINTLLGVWKICRIVSLLRLGYTTYNTSTYM